MEQKKVRVYLFTENMDFKDTTIYECEEKIIPGKSVLWDQTFRHMEMNDFARRSII